MKFPYWYKLGVLVLVSVLVGCASSPPSDPDNLCEIFTQKSGWYKSALKSAERWGGPVHVPMAIMFQESSFKRKAKPPMQYFLGVVPTGRASDAYGYSQALESTWRRYQKEVGSSFKRRDQFADAYDFVQWYLHTTYQQNGVSKWDAYAQYLNYHEGHGGYVSGSYQDKQWLKDTARRVAQRASRYSSQYQSCKARLDKSVKGWF